ncbi:MAG: hypothetical protein V1874_04515 [Spirochaetota bacterium]
MKTNNGKELKDVIKKAIDDQQVTQAEYEEIIRLSQEDGVIDKIEKALLKELMDMISNKTIKRVK